MRATDAFLKPARNDILPRQSNKFKEILDKKEQNTTCWALIELIEFIYTYFFYEYSIFTVCSKVKFPSSMKFYNASTACAKHNSFLANLNSPT